MNETGRLEQPQKADALGLEAEKLAARLPPLLVEAERLSSIVGLGVHGRRKAGSGETFWQFRRYTQGDGTNAIDWRQSAKSQHLFVREREWEAVEAVWFWCDTSAGMHFASDRNISTKFDRASLLALALASLLFYHMPVGIQFHSLAFRPAAIVGCVFRAPISFLRTRHAGAHPQIRSAGAAKPGSRRARFSGGHGRHVGSQASASA